MGILGRLSEAEAGMMVIRNDSKSVHWHQLCDEKENKEKPHCLASDRGIPQSSFVACEAPRV